MHLAAQVRDAVALQLNARHQFGHAVDQTVAAIGAALTDAAAAAEAALGRAEGTAAATARKASQPPDAQLIAVVDLLNRRGESPLCVACTFWHEIPKDTSMESFLKALPEIDLVNLLVSHRVPVQGDSLSSPSRPSTTSFHRKPHTTTMQLP
jgi:hypothetical protein